jgi:hypothetical protein
MKTLLLPLFLLAFAVTAVTAQTTWKSPDYKPSAMRRVMVYAKVSNDVARRQLEDFTVKFLKDKGIDAITAYGNLTRTKFSSREDFLAYTDTLRVDGLLVFNVEDAEEVVENRPTVSVGVGVGGMYGGYVGASAPIAGGATTVMMVHLSGTWFTRATTGKQWIIELSGKLEGSTDKLAYSVAKTTAKAMLREGLFPAKK